MPLFRFVLLNIVLSVTYKKLEHRVSVIKTKIQGKFSNIKVTYKRQDSLEQDALKKYGHELKKTEQRHRGDWEKLATFLLLQRSSKSHLFDCFQGCSKLFPAPHAQANPAVKE